MEMRRHRRRPVEPLVQIEDFINDGRIMGRLLDLSPGGGRILGDQALREDALYQVRLGEGLMPGAKGCVDAGIQVCWVRNSGSECDFGFRFIDLSPESRRHLLAWCA